MTIHLAQAQIIIGRFAFRHRQLYSFQPNIPRIGFALPHAFSIAYNLHHFDRRRAVRLRRKIHAPTPSASTPSDPEHTPLTA